jgi:stearoyl-CoA desaturase (delta-9 desaturase)
MTIDNLSNPVIQRREENRRHFELLVATSVVIVPLVGSILTIYLATRGIGGSATDWGVLLVMYFLSMIGVELGYHRYFTHRSFKAGPIGERLLGILGSMSVQGPVIWWTSVHRRHHAYSDKPGDPHSPHGGVISNFLPLPFRFVYGHVAWLFNIESTRPFGWNKYVREMYQSDSVFRIHMQYWYWALAGIVLPGVADALITQSLQGLVFGILWGGLLRIFLAHHAFWSINSVGHLIGGRSFDTRDKSRNNLVVALLTLGQGWHNNHHAFPSSARVGLRWWQVDMGWWILRIAQGLGLVKELKQPTTERMQERRISV